MSLYKHSGEDDLVRRLPASLRREKIKTVLTGGAESLTAVTVSEGRNLSPRCAPHLATRAPRGMNMTAVGSGTPHGMAVFGENLYFARGTALYCMNPDAVLIVGTVSDTDKKFFTFGDRLYILPDKLYVEAGGITLKPMELDSGVLRAEFKGNTVTLPEGMSWTGLGFSAGDCLRVVNADTDIPAPEADYRILSVKGRVATLPMTFPVTYQSLAYLRRPIPDMDGVCVNGNRVYGFAGKTVYVSAAGCALNFYAVGASDGSDPVTMGLDSEGRITACKTWQGYVVFFKSDRICKLMGSRSDSLTLQDRPAVGLTARLAGTLCEVAGDLYYLAESGVYRYRGQEPERISTVGADGVRGGLGGTDGDTYYLAVKRKGELWRMYSYVPQTGLWYAEDELHPAAMLCRDGFLCVQDAEGFLWRTSSDGRNTVCVEDERARFGEIDATVVIPPDYGFQPEGCRPVGISLRATAKDGEVTPTLEVFAEYALGSAGQDADGSREISLGICKGPMTDRLLKFPLVPRPCDGVRIRLAMTGDWVIHEVMREYEK